MFKVKGLSQLIVKTTLQFQTSSSRLSNNLSKFQLTSLSARFISQDKWQLEKERLSFEPKKAGFLKKGGAPKEVKKVQSKEPQRDQPPKGESQQATLLEQAFMKKFGKIKSQMLDSWLEMSNNQLIEECKVLGVKHSDKHIENMQKLFDYLKAFEKELSTNSTVFLQNIEGIKNVTAPIEQQQYSSTKSIVQKPKMPILDNEYQRKYALRNDKANNQQLPNTQQSPAGQRLTLDELAKAKLEFQSDLERIFQNKKKSRSLFQGERQQQQREEYDPYETQYEDKPSSYVETKAPKIDKNQEYIFNNDSMRKALEKRGQLLEYTQSHNFLHNINQNMTSIKFESPQDINDKLLNDMNLNKNDFNQMPSLIKKKILLNMQFVNEANINSPNSKQFEGLNQDDFIKFVNNNWEVLSPQNQQNVISKVQRNLFYQEITPNILKSNVQYPYNFVNLANKIGNSIDFNLLATSLEHSYKEKLDQIYQLTNIEQILQHAYIISYLSTQKRISQESLQQIQNSFNNGIKKNLTKKAISQLQLEEKLLILKVLPQHENSALISKSHHYNILNEILTNEKPDSIRLMNKEDVFMMIDKVMEMQEHQKSRDIFNKLKGQLLFINSSRFTIEDFDKIFDKLALDKNQPKEDGAQADATLQIDIKLFSLLMMGKSIKTISHIPQNCNLDMYVNLYEKIYKHIPFYFAFMRNEGRFMLYRFIELSQQMLIHFNTLVSLAKIVIPSLYNPSIFFSEMIERQDQSFRNPFNVDPKNVKDLVKEITHRMDEGEHSFEHLQLSYSRIHKNYQPFSNDSILLINRILNDLVGSNNQQKEKINAGQVGVINKIFSNELISMKLFTTQQEALQIINNSLDQQLQLDWTQIHQMESKDKHEFLDDLFKSIDNQQTLLQFSNNEEVQKKSQVLLEIGMKELNSDLQEIKFNSFEEIININQSILNALRHFKDLKSKYQNSHPAHEVVQVMLESYYLQKKPIIQRFEQIKKNVRVQKMISETISKSLIQNNIGGLIQHLLQTNSEHNKQISLIMLLTLENSRKLLKQDLANIFLLMNKYSISEQLRSLMINVTPNLVTIDQRKFYPDNEDESPSSFIQIDNQIQKDNSFEQTQAKREKQDQELKNIIIHKFLDIWNHQPTLLTTSQNSQISNKQGIGLGPLSKLMADILDEFSDTQVLNFLQILGSNSVDNYHGDFIKKLYKRFSNQNYIESLFKNNHKLFFELARQWPHFLKNNAILAQLIQIKHTKVLVAEQSETLSILANKNVLHPDLIETHFETFIKMRDKDSVGKYIKDLLASCAFLGYAKIDMAKLTQVFRRIHKEPALIEDHRLILDYLIVLSLSDVYYKDLDEKSAKFVEDCIEVIEKKFTGIQTIDATIKDDLTQEEEVIKLNYFNPIETNDKIYNKAIIKTNKEPKMEQLKMKEEAKNEEDSSEKSNEEDSSEDDEAGVTKQKDLKNEIERWEIKQHKKKLLDQIKQENHQGIKTKPHEEDDSLMGVKMSKSLDSSQPEDAIDNEEDEEEDSQSSPNEKKIYERKASESKYSEELEFHQFRKKKIAALDKKAKHLLLFSNVNQLNFVDINKSDFAKAWVVLFHFKSKTFDSIIFDEFESIAMRNTIGKSKGHELFIKFYMKVLEVGYKRGCKVQIASKCDKTGWPIDITLINNENTHKRAALYFLLQEELCINAKTNQEEPLGLHKLMLKHLTHISNYKVEYVTENQIYSKKDNLNPFIDEFFDNKLQKSLDLKKYQIEEESI